MATIDFDVRIRQEELDIDVNPALQEVTLATVNSLTVTETVAANDADGLVTLWDAATSPMGSFAQAIIEVDPVPDLSAANALLYGITVQLTTAAGTTFALKVMRGCPLVLTSNVAGATAAAANSTIASIKVRNLNAAQVLKVRAIVTI